MAKTGRNEADSKDETRKEAEPFPLLDLPPELWIHCCRLAVIESEPIQILCLGSAKELQKRVAPPAITRTCSAIRNETLSTFYGSNEFRLIDHGLYSVRGLQAWVKRGGEGHWPLVKRCVFETQYDDLQNILRKAFPGKRVSFSTDYPVGTGKRGDKVEFEIKIEH